MKTERLLWHFIKDNDLPPVDKSFSKTYYLACKLKSGKPFVDLAKWTYVSSKEMCIWKFTESCVDGPVERYCTPYAWAEIGWPSPPKE